MFAYRHDILKALIADGVKLVVLGPHERMRDLPEFKNAEMETVDLTARFMDYSQENKLLVVGQENVLADPGDPYATGCQVIRAFAKALYYVTGTRPVDPNWDNRGRNVQQYELRVERMDIRFDERLKALHDGAIGRGLWKGTAAVHNRIEYWAEGVLAYFDATGVGTTPTDADHPIAARETLRQYDPDLYALVDETMAYKGKVDWRYGW
jgi:alpha-glucosidase